jgi:hypothetical protein
MKKINQRIKEKYEQTWIKSMREDQRKRVGEKNKLRTYRLFKYSFQIEDYLTHVHNKDHRKYLSIFRMGSHVLHIETGRHNKTDPAERFCYVCNIEAVEDERHFMMDCTGYTQLRKKLYDVAAAVSRSFDKLNNHEKFIWLMASRHPTICRAVAECIYEAFQMRSNIIEGKVNKMIPL